MCTYQTMSIALRGSAKGPGDWFRATSASVYYDHPVHALADHTLNIDLLNSGMGSSARVAIELNPGSARALAEAITAALDAVPDRLYS